jgi:hypothetical protein
MLLHLDLFHMSAKTLVGPSYQLTIETVFTAPAGLVVSHQEDGLTIRVEGERYTPHATSGMES